jgi:glutaredoxin-like protein
VANLLNDSIRAQVREVFENQLRQPVGVIFFEENEACETCADTRQLLEEVSGLSEKVTLKVYDLVKDTDLAKRYNVDKAPGIVFVGKDDDQELDYGVRMSGIPSGHEFSTLIHDLILVSGRDSGLEQETRQALQKLSKPVHLQVFVTPT